MTHLLLVLPVLLTASCTWKGGRSTPLGVEFPGSVWRPEPVRLRVYPSSRFVTEDDLPLLEARIELIDEMNDSLKAAGTFRFELYPTVTARTGLMGADRLYAWDVSLHSLDDQRRYYDPITRTYLFRLRLDDLQAAHRGTHLVATFTTIDGRRLETEAALGEE